MARKKTSQQAPDTARKELSDTLKAALNRIDPAQIREDMERSAECGTPFFTLDDLRTTTNPLTRLIRLLFIQNNITRERFDALHRKLALQTYMGTNAMNYDRNNMRRALMSHDITFNFFEKVLTVCGFNLANLSITLVDRESGETMTLSSQEAVEKIKDNPYHPSIVMKHITSVPD